MRFNGPATAQHLVILGLDVPLNSRPLEHSAHC